MTRLRLLAAVGGATLLIGGLAACSGVPSSSAPEVLGPAQPGGSPASEPLITPQPGADPRQIVQDFLRANAGEPADPRGAQLFLTPRQQRQWNDDTVTMVDDLQVNIQTGNGQSQSVEVDGSQTARIDANGSYKATLPQSSTQPPAQWTWTYHLTKVNGQWRITNPQRGLIVAQSDFPTYYRPSKIYFFDQSESRLVPDLRYTALTSPQALASWQLAQLLAGPSVALANAVRTELPNVPLSAHPTVTVNQGSLITVEIPGSAQLDPDTKLRLAAQLMATLGQASNQTIMMITDGGNPVAVPKIPEQFSRSDISAATGLFGAPQPPVFYLDDRGQLVDADRGTNPVPGRIGAGLTSVALAARQSANYLVAATTGSGNDKRLLLGTMQNGLRPVSGVKPGPLSRPTWAPGASEVWVADGATLYRVGADGAATAVASGFIGGHVTAIRFSPDGARLAMVVDSQVLIAPVVRTDAGAFVRFDPPWPVTPDPDASSFSFSDVAWNDDTTLYLVGRDQARTSSVWQVQVDGSRLAPRASSGLPSVPDSITAAPGSSLPPWVSARGAVFQELHQPSPPSWAGPDKRTTFGNNPVYLE